LSQKDLILQGKCCRDPSASIQASSRLYVQKKVTFWVNGRTDEREENNIPPQLRCEGIINIIFILVLV